ncbi:MAG TPA: hypothetical protein DFR83_08515 [Deltaproteobacteria bacterium]|nr:hypothetical protein [Deltaproteobacteria bacterium]
MAGGVLLALALVWRLWIGTRYAGWEESDYGNLAMIEGVRAGAFLHYDMNHMPGYYALAAVVHVVVDNAVVAGRVVALAGGMGAFAGSLWIAWRLGGRLAAALTGVWLLVQPEFALYAATTLREPVYALAMVGFVAALTSKRARWAGLFGALAFSVRFDAAIILTAATGVHVWKERRALLTAVEVLLPIAAAALLWSIYCWVDHGTFAFWSHAVAVNVETGLGAESERPLGWLLAGTEVALQLVAWLLPWRVGWGIWLAGVAAMLLTPWNRPGPVRTLAGTTFMATGFWAAVGFVGQHSPEHNLYWKWMMPLVPLWAALASVTWSRWWGQAGRRRGVVAVALSVVCLQALGSHLNETQRQVELSQELYAPQLELARWIEADVGVDVPLLIDNIPACWINRQSHERTLVSWFDVPVSSGSEREFADWLRSEGIPWVLWFREDWTQAPRVAPFLSTGGRIELPGLELVEHGREDSYGWILYEARGEGIPVHTGAPPPRGDLGPVRGEWKQTQ